LSLRPYIDVSAGWPATGRHILASYDDDTVIVYQAYRPAIAAYATKHQRFGGEFSFSRMSWIKPNFLWMMFRSGWATKEGQERILSIRLRRVFFDSVLAQAVPSSFDPARYASDTEWRTAVSRSDVRLQWDPDHDPLGAAVERRAVQLGLRGSVLRAFAEAEALSIEDITPLVMEQKGNLHSLRELMVPDERVYSPSPEAARAVGVDGAA
jgi:hypothetical protein